MNLVNQRQINHITEIQKTNTIKPYNRTYPNEFGKTTNIILIAVTFIMMIILTILLLS